MLFRSLGFEFYGAAPDFGAFESNFLTTIESALRNTDKLFYPNPVQQIMYFNQQMSSVEIVDIQGKLAYSGQNVHQMNLSAIKTGIYLIKMKIEANIAIIQKFIKY